MSLGEIKAPEGMEEGWKDPYPLPLRFLALVKWTLLVLFQVMMVMMTIHVTRFGLRTDASERLLLFLCCCT